jgi:glycosyltransferase involved in cell wall biosynthesis
MPDTPRPSRKALIAAILPIFNEELNVSGVLDVLRASSILDEIILVDDGSSDRTFEILNQAAALDQRVQVIRHDQNRGKGQAIFSGWAATCAPILLLLDADLKDLTPDHINVLLAPVIDHRADMTLGLFQGGHLSTDLSHRLTPFLTGQRGLRAKLLKDISPEAAAGYGFEIALSVTARQHNYRTRVVPLKGVWHPSSEFRAERGFWGGLLWKLHMYGQVIRALYISTREQTPKEKAFFSNISKL